MYYLKQSYSDQIIICNPENEIICRVMHYDFKNEEEAIQQAEIIVNSLNKEEVSEDTKISIRDFIQKYDVEKLEGLKVVGFDKPQTVRLTKNDIESLKELKPTQNIRLTTNRGNWIYSNDEVFYSEEEEEETKDLFEFYEDQPEAVSSILKHYGDLEALDYKQCEEMLKNLETIGYTFDYGLDAQPFNLRKI